MLRIKFVSAGNPVLMLLLSSMRLLVCWSRGKSGICGVEILLSAGDSSSELMIMCSISTSEGLSLVMMGSCGGWGLESHN